MPRKKIGFIEECFILYNKDKMTVEEIASFLPGIGPKSVENFIISHNPSEEKNIEENMPKQNQPEQSKRPQSQQSKKRIAPVKNLFATDKNRRATVMTQQASQYGDEASKRNLSQKRKIHPNVFIPDPTRKPL